MALGTPRRARPMMCRGVVAGWQGEADGDGGIGGARDFCEEQAEGRHRQRPRRDRRPQGDLDGEWEHRSSSPSTVEAGRWPGNSRQ